LRRMVLIGGMTIWILALILLGACVALGHKLGAIRAAITFVGIPIAALLAAPLSSLIKPLFPLMKVENPIWLWVLPPFVMFVILIALFKVVGQLVHHKVYVHYKHYTDELQMGWWERMNHRVGFCIARHAKMPPPAKINPQRMKIVLIN